MSTKKNKLQWLLRGGLGCVLIGFGLCATIESAFLKHESPENSLWIVYGTLSLTIFMAGLNILLSALPYVKKEDERY
jgi:hypothetical protein